MKKKDETAYVPLKGSEKVALQEAQLNTVPSDEIIEVTIRVRRKTTIQDALVKGKVISREEYENEFGASEEDMEAVEAFANKFHLTIVESDKARRSVIVKGKTADFEQAFQVHLGRYTVQGKAVTGRSGSIHIPCALAGIIEGVFGLDNRPVAKPMFQWAEHEDGHFIPLAAATGSFTPVQVAKAYGFPTGVNGKGQTIAIIELGGGFRNADITNYFTGLGLPVPSVKAVSVDGAINHPTTASSADGEVMLDIEVAGAVAPGANIVVYFAPNSDKGFLDAITTAIHDNINKPSVISISWGGAEKSWTQQSLNSYNQAFQTAALLGVTVTVASGDTGSSDSVNDGKVHVDFPASSPFVLACGGTSLKASNNHVTSELVWHNSNTSATGGGVSEFFPLPSYQQNANVPKSASTNFKGRGVPDVAGDADPNTGYQVLVDGQHGVIGGTSAVAPLMAGLIALINQQKAHPAGFINPAIYANASHFCRDITQGNNITTSTHKGYTAGPGWDACTGWGVLNKL